MALTRRAAGGCGGCRYIAVRLERQSATLHPLLAQALPLCYSLPLSLAARRPGKRDDAKGLAKLRAVGAAARLSTRPYICLERCDLGVAYGEGLLHTGARHVFHPHPELVAFVVLLEGPVASQRS